MKKDSLILLGILLIVKPYLSPGIGCKLGEYIQLGIGFPIGLTYERNDWGALSGYSVNGEHRLIYSEKSRGGK